MRLLSSSLAGSAGGGGGGEEEGGGGYCWSSVCSDYQLLNALTEIHNIYAAYY